MSHDQRTVLAVDDNDDMRTLLLRDLAESGYQVEVAAGAKQALELLQSRAVDLALVDLVLSGTVTGERLAEMLARLGCRVIMMSGLVNAEERLSLLPYPFLVKPFRLTTLVSLIEKTLGPAPPGDRPRRTLMPSQDRMDAALQLRPTLPLRGGG